MTDSYQCFVALEECAFQQLTVINLHTESSRLFSPVESIISVIDGDYLLPYFTYNQFASVIFPPRTVDKFTLIQATQSINAACREADAEKLRRHSVRIQLR